MIWVIISLAIYLSMVFFAVRIAMFEFCSDRKARSDDWAFAIGFGSIPLVGYLTAMVSANSSSIRRAHFIPPKRDKKVKVKKYPYVRAALGKIFMIEKG